MTFMEEKYGALFDMLVRLSRYTTLEDIVVNLDGFSNRETYMIVSISRSMLIENSNELWRVSGTLVKNKEGKFVANYYALYDESGCIRWLDPTHPYRVKAMGLLQEAADKRNAT